MSDIILPIAAVTAIGLICGVLLSLANKFMSVKADKTESEIRDHLPGVNCGACGYAGCDAYAKALAERKGVSPNLCTVGGNDAAAEISKILGIEPVKVERYAARVLCNKSCTNGKKHIYDGIRTCAAENLYYASSQPCSYACIGLGDCVKVCPVGAICIDSGTARIDPERCIDCRKCVNECPKHIIKPIPYYAKYEVLCSNKEKGATARKDCKNACIGCMKCEKVCPSGAVSVKDNLASIDHDKCTACGLCESICPVGCIKHYEKRQ